VKKHWRDIFLVFGGAALIWVAAWAAFPLPVNPVPVTLQSLAVLACGAVLGPRRGVLAVAVYLLAGLLGLPVFAGSSAGPGHFAGATGGYLLGFLPAALLCGWLSRKGHDRSFRGALISLLLGHGVIFLLGVPWLASFSGLSAAFRTGLVPFLPGAAVKSLAGAVALAVWRRRPI
jgi:biotin transport system substrate-specific component